MFYEAGDSYMHISGLAVWFLFHLTWGVRWKDMMLPGGKMQMYQEGILKLIG